MNLFSVFKISEIYYKYKNGTHAYNNGRVFVEIENAEISNISTNDGIPANAEEIKAIVNFAIGDITQKVRAEFGF